MKKSVLIASIVVGLAFVLTLPAISKQDDKEAQRLQEARKHSEWVAKSLKEMQTVKVGMSREELLKVFEGEGGLSTRNHRTYVYRECPYIKVDVDFETVDDSPFEQDKRDKIVKISKPYLAWSVTD